MMDMRMNRESRGRRPRPSLKEEKKRFRPSVITIVKYEAIPLVACWTLALRIPYAV